MRQEGPGGGLVGVVPGASQGLENRNQAGYIVQSAESEIPECGSTSRSFQIGVPDELRDQPGSLLRILGRPFDGREPSKDLFGAQTRFDRGQRCVAVSGTRIVHLGFWGDCN